MQYRSVLAFLVLCTAAQAADVDEEPASVPIPAERLKACTDGGGCVYVTKDELRGLAEKMFDAGKRYSDATCASRIEFRER